MQKLQEKMCRRMNLFIRDESDDEREGGQVYQEEQEEEFLDLEEENIFKAITKIEKRPKFDVPKFSRNLNLEGLIDWINELED